MFGAAWFVNVNSSLKKKIRRTGKYRQPDTALPADSSMTEEAGKTFDKTWSVLRIGQILSELAFDPV